jgi:4a-hydroxytetrahydrobiopterin dehydratase
MTEHCKSCHEAANILTIDAINEALKAIEGWSYDPGENVIQRHFEFKGFGKTMALINAIAWISHVEKHHPDIRFGYNYATVAYQTHEANGITENDIICAKKVNTLLD